MARDTEMKQEDYQSLFASPNISPVLIKSSITKTIFIYMNTEWDF